LERYEPNKSDDDCIHPVRDVLLIASDAGWRGTIQTNPMLIEMRTVYINPVSDIISLVPDAG